MGRRWIVTGASRGIGAAIAEEAASAGDKVALVARTGDVELQATALRDRGLSAIAIREDVTERGVAARVVELVSNQFGGIDVLVNCAGLHRGGRIERLSEDDFEAVLSCNLIAPFQLCRAAVERMEAGAAIINIGAVVGLRGFVGDTPYGSSKAGLAGLTRILAVELARRPITVNMVVPGFTETDMTAGLDERARERILRRIPLGRPATAEETARVVRWVSETPYMTGAIIPVDGGLMAAIGSIR